MMTRGDECYPDGAGAGGVVLLPGYRGLYSFFVSFDLSAAVYHLSTTD